ncbi:MAG: hypothetical protein IJL23_03580, partial [Alphaproteobacteria bacterium]|nr:hypothetical protein [Alphaproteobacteria bacterium]
MKKIFLFSLIVCMGIVDVGFAADKGTYNCRVQSIAALSKKKSNEFLFPTNGDYKDANGRALVCGHRGTDGCTNGTTVVVAGNHWFQKSQSDYMKVYRCSTGGGNAWADVGYTALNECSSSQKENWNKIGEIQGQKILCADKIDTFYRGGYCKNACFTSDCTDCNKPEPTPQPAPTPTPQPDPTPTPTPGKKTCAERYAGYPERIACCEAGSATEWIGDLQNGKCLCKRLKIDGNEIPLRPVLSLGEVSGKMTAQCIPNIRILAA